MSAQVQENTKLETRCDAAVIGSGLAGLAAAIQLAKAGMSVICIDPEPKHDAFVGESLDWSAPELLRQIGLATEELIEGDASTYKRHVTLKLPDGCQAEYVPSDWLAEAPLNIELKTLHVDRARLHQKLLQLANSLEVSFVSERVKKVERTGSRVRALRGTNGLHVIADWVIDASGSAASFLGREFHLPSVEYGPRKVAMWRYFHQPFVDGTKLYADAPAGSYMQWIWEIPINAETVSVGYISPAETVKRKRAQRFSVEQIYMQQLSKFGRFDELLRSQSGGALNVTTFQCRTFRRTCGPNWAIVGEAASVPDPITSNGVTAALRHALEATRLICQFRTKRRIPGWARAAYSARVINMARFFNSLIEKIVYNAPVRDRIGLLKAGDVYTIPAWSINHLYSRLQPFGLVSSALFSLFLSSVRGTAWLFFKFCRLLAIARGVQPVPAFTR